MMSQKNDRVLAELAWRVLWLREIKSDRTHQITESDDAEAHAHRPC